MVFAGPGSYYPPIPVVTLTPSLSAAVGFSATGDKIAQIGRIWWPGMSGTKNITRVGFRTGPVVKAGGSAFTLSLQAIDTVNGPIFRPDGVMQQSTPISNAQMLTSAWITSPNLNAVRTVSPGDMFAVVWEFDGAGRLGADTVPIAGMTLSSSSQYPINDLGAVLQQTTGTWALGQETLNLIFEFDDGTFGTFEGSMPCSAFNSHAINVATAGADEYANTFTPPYDCDIDALWAVINTANVSADTTLNLYDGTTLVYSVAIDVTQVLATGARTVYAAIPKTHLTAGHNYYVSVAPTTANNNTIYSLDVANVLHMGCVPGGSDFQFTTRVDGGAWAAPTATRRLWAGVRFTSVFF